MKVIWAILCQSAVIDKDSNNVSLLNIIEEITIPAEPPLIEQPAGEDISQLIGPGLFDFVILWSRSDPEVAEHGLGRIRLLLPNNEPLFTSTEFEVDLTRYLRSRLRSKFPGFPTRRGEIIRGIYDFVVESRSEGDEWEERFVLPLRVALQTAEATPGS